MVPLWMTVHQMAISDTAVIAFICEVLLFRVMHGSTLHLAVVTVATMHYG